jgi:diguanylate cyclase (GGDEF)-like protein
MLPFLDPDGEPNHFDRLHILDFVQVGILAVSIFLCFSRRMWSPATAFRIGPILWSRNIAFDGLLVATFVVRALLAKSRAVRSLFLRMALFLTLSGIADSYSLNPESDLQSGGWFDLIWAAFLAIPILIAATWKSEKEGQTAGSPKSQTFVVNQVFPLAYPLISFLVLARVNRAYPTLSTILFALEAQAETTIDGILVVDEFDHIILANKQFGFHLEIPFELLSTRDDRIVLKHMTDKVEAPDAFIERVKYLNSHRDEKSRDEFRLKNGKVFDRYSAPLVDSNRHYRGRIWYFRDITHRKIAEERIQFLAYYDALTGLPNRTLLLDRLAKALAAARRQNNKLGLLYLDLDRFKDINDSLGHSVGDLFLQEVAGRLKRWGREQDTVARLGGDEFLIMLTDVKDIPDAAVAAERLMDAMTADFVVQGHTLGVSCSLGISVFPEHGADSETLIKNADAAIYRAKADGRNNFRFFTDDMNAQAVERLTLESNLRSALAKEQLFLMYQPQIDIATGRIIGLEALLRWQHPTLGLVPPDRFIRIAENSGLIVLIGEWVLRTACSQARKWQNEGLPLVTVAVNVSAVQFRQEGFCELIRRVLHETGLAAQYLALELTESLLLANADLMLSVLRELKAMGLTLAIDDFGTGYSNFTSLRQFGVSKLKIDRSFIRDVAVKPDDAAITTAIISMAKSLNLKVIAEGVEDEAQMSFLRTHHCDEIQGYYFSKPLKVDDVAGKLRGGRLDLHARAQASGVQS